MAPNYYFFFSKNLTMIFTAISFQSGFSSCSEKSSLQETQFTIKLSVGIAHCCCLAQSDLYMWRAQQFSLFKRKTVDRTTENKTKCGRLSNLKSRYWNCNHVEQCKRGVGDEFFRTVLVFSVKSISQIYLPVWEWLLLWKFSDCRTVKGGKCLSVCLYLR